MTRIRGVFFDLGGVVFDSPFEAIDRFEQVHGIDQGAVTGFIVKTGRDGPWGRLERGEIGTSQFSDDFEQVFRVPGEQLLAEVASVMRVRPTMAELIRHVRSRGYLAVAITNNWAPMTEPAVCEMFDDVVESVVEGFNKPDVQLYEIALERNGLAPGEVVMLDDIGRNLKVAAQLGLKTIKVSRDVDTAIETLESLLRQSELQA